MKRTWTIGMLSVLALAGCETTQTAMVGPRGRGAGGPAACPPSGCPMAATFDEAPAGEITDGTRGVLLEALADERRSEALYQAVLDSHGRVMPFANIVNSERMHAQHVEQLMRARGMDVPADETSIEAGAVPATLAACYGLGVRSELDNIAMYDRLLTQTDDEGVREAFGRLRAMSEERHLVAFRRFAGE